MVRKVVCLFVVAALAVGVAFMSGRLLARADDAAPDDGLPKTFTGEFPVALVDVGSIFRNYEAFEQRMNELKQKLVQAEQDFKAESEEITDLTEQLKSLDAQSEEYRQLEEEVASRQVSLQVRMDRAKKEFMGLEADIYAETYGELQGAVEKYAKAHGIRLVVRYMSDPIDPDDPKSVMKGVNRDIVFQDGIDITEEILHFLNEKKVS